MHDVQIILPVFLIFINFLLLVLQMQSPDEDSNISISEHETRE